MSDVAPLQLANIVNGRYGKARDGNCQFTLEDKIWLHVALVDTLPKHDWSTGGSFSISLQPTRSCIALNTSLDCAVICSSHCADTSSQIVTLPRGKKRGPRSASQADSFRNALPLRRAFLWVDATTFRTSFEEN